MIDPHVHCRDWGQKHKETIEHALYVADRAGLSGIFDMPNTSPPVDSYDLVKDRLDGAEFIGSDVFYGLYVGLTSNPEQIREVVDAWREFFPRSGDDFGVVGLKMFAGHSVGNLGIIQEAEQRQVYRVLTDEDFNGVLAVHCEKESLLRPDLWDSSNPITHCYARPPRAEVESVKDQIRFAKEAEFSGHLHILHVSVPETVDLVDASRKEGMKISCEVTPNHLLISNEVMRRNNGILYKVNPPLRGPEIRRGLLERFKNGLIDVLGSDHAPHTLAEKTGKDGQYMSGIPGLFCWSHYITDLAEVGADGDVIIPAVHENINEIFGTSIPYKGTHGADGLARWEDIEDLAKDYAFNPCEAIK